MCWGGETTGVRVFLLLWEGGERDVQRGRVSKFDKPVGKFGKTHLYFFHEQYPRLVGSMLLLLLQSR